MIIKKNQLYIFLIFTLLLTACVGGCASKPPALPVLNQAPGVPDVVRDYPPEPVSGKTVSEYFKDEGIAFGWNLGNSLDSYSGGRDIGWLSIGKAGRNAVEHDQIDDKCCKLI